MSFPTWGSPFRTSTLDSAAFTDAARLRRKITICQVCSVERRENGGIADPRIPLRMFVKIMPSATPHLSVPVRAGPRSPRQMRRDSSGRLDRKEPSPRRWLPNRLPMDSVAPPLCPPVPAGAPRRSREQTWLQLVDCSSSSTLQGTGVRSVEKISTG